MLIAPSPGVVAVDVPSLYSASAPLIVSALTPVIGALLIADTTLAIVGLPLAQTTVPLIVRLPATTDGLVVAATTVGCDLWKFGVPNRTQVFFNPFILPSPFVLPAL